MNGIKMTFQLKQMNESGIKLTIHTECDAHTTWRLQQHRRISSVEEGVISGASNYNGNSKHSSGKYWCYNEKYTITLACIEPHKTKVRRKFLVLLMMKQHENIAENSIKFVVARFIFALKICFCIVSSIHQDKIAMEKPLAVEIAVT